MSEHDAGQPSQFSDNPALETAWQHVATRLPCTGEDCPSCREIEERWKADHSPMVIHQIQALMHEAAMLSMGEVRQQASNIRKSKRAMRPSDPHSLWMTCQDVEAALRISGPTRWRLQRDGKLVPKRRGRYYRPDVEAYAQHGEECGDAQNGITPIQRRRVIL